MNDFTSGLVQARPFISVGILVALLAWESFSGFFHFMKGRGRLRHGFLNLFLGVFNSLITGLAFVGLWWLAARWAEQHQFGLLYWLGMPWPLRFIIAFLAFDAWMYAWHRLNHRVPLFWRFHRVHHSDPTMDVTTATRFHFGEIILSSVLRLPVILLLGLQMHEIAVYEVLMFAVVQFHHANIALPEKLDRFLRVFIVTPFMHKVHHSRWQPETDSNYASFLSVWDRLFGSFRLNPNPASLRFGLDEFAQLSHQTLGGMVGTPWAVVKKGEPAKRGGIARAGAIVIPAIALVAGAWWLTMSMTPAEDRLAAMKAKFAKEFPDVERITTGELAAWMTDPEKAAPQILDAREPDEFEMSHLSGAVRVSPDGEAEDILKRIDAGRPVVVYCSVGYRSSVVVRRLKEAGVKEVMNLEGSIFEWANEGRPLVSKDKPAKVVHPFNAGSAKLLKKEVRGDLSK